VRQPRRVVRMVAGIMDLQGPPRKRASSDPGCGVVRSWDGASHLAAGI